ncbi:MAG TPA: triose-phosphate isomerase [Patescibacteria group bacterium]|nr:triose-phosphate isomerase [Patescibacteria group bacterium]
MKKFVVGNLKMNLVTRVQRDDYVKELANIFVRKKNPQADVIVCPPHVYLEYFCTHLPKKIHVGAQDIFWETQGSYTSHVSPQSVSELGAIAVILGHSERRLIVGETYEVIGKKVVAALKQNLCPIICFGRTEQEQAMDPQMRILLQQVREALFGVKKEDLGKIMLVHEPLWAVGTDRTPTSNDIMEVRLFFRKILSEMYGTQHVESPPILYGGSVHKDNLTKVCIEPGMDGVLLGRESLFPKEFYEIAMMFS